jgi:hypothetical protein
MRCRARAGFPIPEATNKPSYRLLNTRDAVSVLVRARPRASTVVPAGACAPHTRGTTSPDQRNAAPLVSRLGRACLPSPIVGFFNRAFQPHLDQMQHARINNPARYLSS